MTHIHGFTNIANECARFADLDRLVKTLARCANKLLRLLVYPTDGISCVHVAVEACAERQDQNAGSQDAGSCGANRPYRASRLRVPKKATGDS